MKELDKLIPKDLYHSYIIEGDIKENMSLVLGLLEKRKYNQNDSFIKAYDAFSMEDSKALKEWHNKKRVNDEKRFCIISTKFVNHDAERALLKMIEEPESGTYFFLIVPDSKLLLDTILSRSHLIRQDNKDLADLSSEATAFFRASKKDRIDMVALIIKKNEANVDSGGLRHESIEMLDNIERIIYENFKKDRKNKSNVEILEEISKAREYLALPGSSPKMILEHIALVI